MTTCDAILKVRREIERAKHIVHAAVALSFMVYVATGIAGYLHFGAETKGNILLNYEKEDLLTKAVTAVMVITVISRKQLANH